MNREKNGERGGRGGEGRGMGGGMGMGGGGGGVIFFTHFRQPFSGGLLKHRTQQRRRRKKKKVCTNSKASDLTHCSAQRLAFHTHHTTPQILAFFILRDDGTSPF